MQVHARAEARLRELFGDAGWKVAAPRREGGADLVVSRGGLRYVVEVKAAREARRSVLEGLLASAVLRARVAAQGANGLPLAIVFVPSVSEALLRELGEFVGRYGDGAAWGVIEASGVAHLYGRGLDAIRGERKQLGKAAPVVQQADIYSDLGQWMLKVLLSHALPPDLRMHHPRERSRIGEPLANAMSLAKVSAVSVPSAARFVAALRADGFLLRGAPLRLLRVEELLERWRGAASRRRPEVRCRWLFPAKDAVQQLDVVLRKESQEVGRRVCVGLFAACDRLGFRFVSGVAPHIYLEKVSEESLQRLGLRVAEPGESADVMVREPRYRESVFRGSSQRDGVPVADVLQCWLDVSDHPARGDEMARHLFDRAIAPNLVRARA